MSPLMLVFQPTDNGKQPNKFFPMGRSLQGPGQVLPRQVLFNVTPTVPKHAEAEVIDKPFISHVNSASLFTVISTQPTNAKRA